MSRPPAPGELPPGYTWAAVADHDWTVPAPTWMRCRHTESGVRCRRMADATLWRGWGMNETRPWHYCAAHLYGRWIEAGTVMQWRARATRA